MSEWNKTPADASTAIVAAGDHNSHLPVAMATAVVPVVAADAVEASSPYVYVDIAAGLTGDVVLSGRPNSQLVQVRHIDPKLCGDGSMMYGGLYLHSIQISLPSCQVEITHFGDNHVSVQAILEAHLNVHRRLSLAKRRWTSLNTTDGFYYAYTLSPVVTSLDDLGITLQGFPPRIQYVNTKTSPLGSTVRTGMVVVEVRFPNGAPTPLTAATPGFTAYRVQQELQTYGNVHSNLNGIVLVVKEEIVPVKREKGSSRPLDDCVIQ